MAELDDRVDELRETVEDHDRRDDERFRAFTAAVDGLRADFSALKDTITEALSGKGELPGMKERIRNLERDAQNLRWATGIVFVAFVTETIALVFGLLPTKG